MKQITQSTDFKFSTEEREFLMIKWKLSLLEPKEHPLTKQESKNIPIALKEVQELKRIEIKVAALGLSRQLAKRNKCDEIGTHLANELKPRNYSERLLMDQMATMHVSGMDMLSKAGSGNFGVDEAAKLMKSSTKLMETYQKGMQTLHQVRSSGKQTITVKHQNVQVNGGQAIIADNVHTPTREKNGRGGIEKK